MSLETIRALRSGPLAPAICDFYHRTRTPDGFESPEWISHDDEQAILAVFAAFEEALGLLWELVPSATHSGSPQARAAEFLARHASKGGDG